MSVRGVIGVSVIHSTYESANPGPATIAGSVLVAGCGFVVTGAGWALFGFLEGELTASSMSAMFFLLAIVHGLSGALVIVRQRLGVILGLSVAVIGLGVAITGSQWVLVFTNCVILTLLILARRHVAGNFTQELRARAE